jgi:hypothetical protein
MEQQIDSTLLTPGQIQVVIDAAIRLIYERIRQKEIATSVGDLIRLLEVDAQMSGRAGGEHG